jgi:hypothetical protein
MNFRLVPNVLATALEEIDADLARCCWTPGLPAHITPATARIDREACAEARCERCGQQGLLYAPCGRTAGPRPQYGFHAICPGCGWWSLL